MIYLSLRWFLEWMLTQSEQVNQFLELGFALPHQGKEPPENTAFHPSFNLGFL